MRIEKHNSHGAQLLVLMTQKESVDLLLKLSNLVSNSTPYVNIVCKFEDDNDKWVDADFTFVIEKGERGVSEYSDTKREEPYVCPHLKWKVVSGILYRWSPDFGWVETGCSRLSRNIAEDYCELYRKWVPSA